MIKNSAKVGVQGTLLNTLRALHDRPTAGTVLNGKRGIRLCGVQAGHRNKQLPSSSGSGSRQSDVYEEMSGKKCQVKDICVPI